MRSIPRRLHFLPTDPCESAKIIGLRYVRHEGAGILRRRSGRGFIYLDANGKLVKEAAIQNRIRSLVIPPAWTDVWICPLENGHLQAVGRDAKGRKQYRYHPLYRQIRQHTKFERMVPFGSLLPAIRRRVKQDLKLPGVPKEKVIATIVRLLETSCVRIGNEDYAKENGSYGLTTLRNRHVQVRGDKIRFHFKGKSGQVHDIELDDGKLARIVRRCQSLPGQELFQYISDDGEPARISSEDVNDYLRNITGENFTAKDFRTWAGTVEAVRLLHRSGPAPNQTAVKRTYARVVKDVAAKLGNRPATTKNYYVHPAVLGSYTDGSLFEIMRNRPPGTTNRASRAEELGVIAIVLKHQKIGQPPIVEAKRERKRAA